MKNNYLKIFLKGIFAGLSIGLGSFLFVLCSRFSNKALGSALFAVGLTLVCCLGFYLYTGKIAYLIDSNKKGKYALELVIGYIGNFVGAAALGYLTLLICKLGHMDNMLNTASKVASSRFMDLGNGGAIWYETLFKSMLCGICVYGAVQTFKHKENHFIPRELVLIICVFVFVYGGFEHCIANMYYISLANAWNIQTIVNILIVTLGNSLGALYVNYALRH